MRQRNWSSQCSAQACNDYNSRADHDCTDRTPAALTEALLRVSASCLQPQVCSATSMRGKFITVEGGEGTGKSTHAAMLADRLKSLGIEVVLTREPGGSPGAEVIRHVLLSGAAKPLGVEAEALLFAAARDDHVRSTIEPALARAA